MHPGAPGLRTRWDIAEEHLDEASFLFQLWENALRSPDYTLDEISRGPEERMLAHIEGLVLGGLPVARRLLVPALGGGEPGAAFAAAFALLAGGTTENLEPVLSALARGDGSQRSAVRRALAVVPDPKVGTRLAKLVPGAGQIRTDLLEVLCYRRIDSGTRLEPLAESRDPDQEALALRLARFLPTKLDPTMIERGLGSPDPRVRAAAIESGMVLGVHGAFAAAESTVAEQGPGLGAAMLILGLSGDDRSVAMLSSVLRNERIACEAAFALGFTGRVSAAAALVEAMRDDHVARVAGEAFMAITGLSPETVEDREEERYSREIEPPRPDPEAVSRSWKEARHTDSAQRWLRGRPWGLKRLLWELEQGPAQRRAALALDLAIRTRGQAQILWDDLSARQHSYAENAKALAARCSIRPHYRGW